MKIKEYLSRLPNKFLLIYENNKNKAVISTILKAFSFFYSIIYKSRFKLYKLNILKIRSFDVPVISIGNITCGGTGKTPLVIETAKYLLKEGYKVAVLSRGYNRPEKRSNEGVLLVSDGIDILSGFERSGDEPYLIAKKVPNAIVIVGKDRVQSGSVAIKMDAEILILDDGYQYIRLHRDENILLLDSYSPFDNSYLLPRGKLRELPEAISRSTAIVISNTDKKAISEDDIKKIKQHGNSTPMIPMFYKIKDFSGLNIKVTSSISDMQKTGVIAFCGIGNPYSFFDSLKQNGVKIARSLIFPDHHNYTYDDIKEIIEISKNYKIENIITTEKDAIKVEGLCEASPLTFWTTNLEVEFGVSNPFRLMLKNKDCWNTDRRTV